jgi:glutamate-5-semialdehyde dehydrogenase
MAGANLILTPGMPIVFGGDKLTCVPAELAARFAPGDRLFVIQETGDLLHAPAAPCEIAERAGSAARDALASLAAASDEQISLFYDRFALLLEDDRVWGGIARINARDVQAAKSRGRATHRLAASEAMRRDMIAGLRGWRDAPPGRGKVIERIEHQGWSVEQVTAPLGVVGFVFEGRPNVVADAAGVLRGGNAVVFRIGSDALASARAIIEGALAPALREAGLPTGAVTLIDSAEHAAGWALFADPRLSLAIARGSGPAVAQLGALARQAGTPVSLHGTGGAWLIADATADAERFAAAVRNSLDRKVCNTLNVCVIVRERADDLVPRFLAALAQAGPGARLHATPKAKTLLTPRMPAETIAEADLGREWEWDETPEVSLAVVDDLEAAIGLFNAHGPRLCASLIAEDAKAQERFFAAIDAPFVGDGFTRWVDGQYALGRPELGLSNWQEGRLFGRGAILAGDGVFTVRTRMRQADPNLRR